MIKHIEIRELDEMDVKIYATPLKTLFGYLNPVDANLNDFYGWLKASGKLFGAFGPSNQLLGIATLLMIPKPYHYPNNFMGQIEDVCVLEDMRHEGIGRELVEYLTKYAKSQCCYKVILTCKDSLLPFYYECGYRHTDNLMRIDFNGV